MHSRTNSLEDNDLLSDEKIMDNQIMSCEKNGNKESSELTLNCKEKVKQIIKKAKTENINKEPALQSVKTLSTNKTHPMKLPPIKKRGKNKVIPKSVSDVFELSWKDLSYIVEKSSVPCIPCQTPSISKVILKRLTGSFKSSELTAIMGPSGAGKSTLLSCVCGKQTNGVSGDIRIIGCNQIKVAIITQDDYLTDKLTVKEELIFASKAKNGSKNVNHEEVVQKVVNALCLESCINTLSGRCSGGQRRRISIALELVSKPNILILDEPTSGLDSSSCYQLINNLKELTQQKEPIAIVTTIHQPSARVFNLFDSIYVISCNGQCIYHGSPGDLLQQLSLLNLMCPTFHNPADYIAEIASGEHGTESITKLASYRNELVKNELIMTPSSHTLSQMSQNFKLPAIQHTILLIKRSLKLIPREPHLSWLRLFAHIISSMFLSLIFDSDSGTMSGCPPRIENLYKSKASELFRNLKYEEKRIADNLGSIFFNVLFLLFAGLMPTLMVFPNEVNVFFKQYTNGWYSPMTYFISKIISDIPILVTVTTIYLTIWYVLSDQTHDVWRYSLIILIGIMVSMIGQSQGIMCSALFSTDLVKASYFGTLSMLPFILLSGFFVRTKRIPEYLRPITYLSHTRYAFESLVITIYGFNRCWYPKSNLTLPQPPWLQLFKLMNFQRQANNEKGYNYEEDNGVVGEVNTIKDILAMLSGSSVNTNNYNEFQSMVMSQYEFTDSMLYSHVSILVAYVVFLQIIAYYVLLWKVKHTSR